MTSDPRKHALRLQKRHEPDPLPPPDHAIGERLWEAQSLRNAAVAGVLVIVLFTTLWIMISGLLNRVFPWATILLGFLIGLSVRRAGLGLSWPFPVLAASMAGLGAFVSSLVVAAALVGREFGSSTFSVLADLTSSWSAFAAEALTPADVVFAVVAAAVAAFYSLRRLNRRQYLAFRLWRQTRDR